VSPGDAASGVARIIDEADATQDRQLQCGRFQDAERDVWDLMADYHNYAVDAGLVTDNVSKFSPDFDVSVRFGDQKPIVSDREKIETITMHRTAGLMTQRQAIRRLYPHFTNQEVEDWVKELEEDDSGLQQPTEVDPQATDGQSGP
jgi:hypothetical protein